VAQSSQQPEGSTGPDWVTRHAGTLVTLAGYLLGALYVTAQLWVNPVGRRQIGDVQDVNQATWFMRYTATAIEHFRLPALTTTAMNAPHGVNLMWNTSLLLPGSLATPVTLLFGPQVSLTFLLVVGFAGSAASMFYVLRRWQRSVLAAALGGALYGFSPALINSGLGHYSLVLAIIPPLLIDRLLRIVTRDGSAVRNGLWLGLLAAAQLFISEEALVDTAIAAVILLVVLALCRPREVLARIRPAAVGLGTGVVVALVLCARGLWVQFHGTGTGATPPVSIHYFGHLTNLGTIPYGFVTPSVTVVLHTPGTVTSALNYPQPYPEYLAYLGVPLIIVLLAAIIYFWRNLPVRVAGITCILLEWLGLGAKPLLPQVVTLPGFLLPWQHLQHLPILSGLVPDRLCILADAAAAVVLAYALDLARTDPRPLPNLRFRPWIGAAVVVVALLPVLPSPYRTLPAGGPPPGWSATFTRLDLPTSARVLLAPFPWSDTSQVMRWQAVSGRPATMIGGDFIQPGKPPPGAQPNWGRSGRAALTPTTNYINALWAGNRSAPAPSAAQITADLAAMKPAAVVAETAPGTPLARFLTRLFGPPTTHIQDVLGWRLPAAGG
jgi:hypothetical protein